MTAKTRKGLINRFTISQQLFGLMFIVLASLITVDILSLLHTRTNLLHEKKIETQNVVETAYGTLEYFASQVDKGFLTEDEARQRAAASISGLRYGKNDYFWINNRQYEMVMHSVKPELNGKSLHDIINVDGIAVFAKMVDLVKEQDKGFVDYRWPRAGSDDYIPKTSFVKGFDRWGWVLGSGIYIDDVDEMFWAEVKQQVQLFGLAGIIIAFLYWRVVRQISTSLKSSISVAKSISEGNLDEKIEASSGGETGELLQALATMQSNLKARVEQDRQSAEEINRLKQAMDNVSANVVVANADHEVIYLNNAVQRMFQAAQADLRTVQPRFNAQGLTGQHISRLLEQTQYHDALRNKLSTTSSVEFSIAGRTFKVIANPIVDVDGGYQGVVAEWTDRTQEKAVENEVQSIVQNAQDGELNQRLSLQDKQGFFLNLGTAVNNLLNVNEQIINDIKRVLSAMADGQLNETIDRDYSGSFGQLKHDANASVDKLKEVVSKVQFSAQRMYEVTSEISRGNTDLARRTEEQSASLERTAANMEEMNASVQQNALNVEEANKAALNARQEAEEGGAVVQNTVSAMGEINTSSNKIADIIGVIDEIAFQTNLLALNAAVEAARAGDQGKGFAVVASEVRNLAQRSSVAAGEVKSLIEDSMTKVNEGSRMVDESGAKLDQIVGSVKGVSTIIENITSAGKEQAIGIAQVNQAMTQMEDMTKQNAALVEESATASSSMTELAEDLNELLEFFHFEGRSHRPSQSFINRRESHLDYA